MAVYICDRNILKEIDPEGTYLIYGKTKKEINAVKQNTGTRWNWTLGNKPHLKWHLKHRGWVAITPSDYFLDLMEKYGKDYTIICIGAPPVKAAYLFKDVYIIPERIEGSNSDLDDEGV